VAAVVRRGTVFGIDLVSDVPHWQEYQGRVRLRGTGPGGSEIVLIESVRQDPGRRLTVFDQEFVETRSATRRARRFSLVFRTVALSEMVARLEKAGFRTEAVLGDYEGGRWDTRADVWLLLARRQ
jgi:hypothetical protein